MAEKFVSYVRRYLADPDALATALDVPLLVWKAPTEMKVEARWLGTESGMPVSHPMAGEPVVLELRKRAGSKNPFAMGVTLGRVETNDLIVGHPSVSRFHAFFQPEGKTGQWQAVDAESKNGSWVGPLKLTANQKISVPDGAKLRFGAIEMTFWLPKSFLRRCKDALDELEAQPPPPKPAP